MARHVVGKLKGKGWQAILTNEGWRCSSPHYAVILKHYEPGVYRVWAEEDRYDQRAWGVAALLAAAKALRARAFVRKELLRDRQAEAAAKSAEEKPPADGFEMAWIPAKDYKGTVGKWIDDEDPTKKPRYQRTKPGTRGKKQPAPAGGKKPAAPRKQVPPAQILAELEPHGTDVAKLAGALAKHTYASLQGLAKHLAQKANGKTADLAARLLKKLEERAGQGQTQRPVVAPQGKPQATIADPLELADKLRSERADEHADEVIAAARKAAASLSVDGFRRFVGQVIGDEPRKGQSKKKMLADLESIVNQVGTSRAQTRHIGEPTEKKAAATRSLPSPEELASGEWSGLGNETGNTDLMRVRVGGREYVVKQMQRPDGVEAEAAAGALARALGVNVPEVARARPAPEDVEGWKGFRFAGDDGWAVMPHAPGKPLKVTDLENPKVRAEVLNDLLAAYALGNNDRNDANLLVDGDAVTSLDWEPSFSEATDPDHYAQSSMAGELPDDTPLDRATLARVVGSGDDILRAAAGFTHLPGFTEDKSKVGEKADGAARVRLGALRRLAALPNPTLGDFRRALAEEPVKPQEKPAAQPQAKKPVGAKPQEKPAEVKPEKKGDATRSLVDQNAKPPEQLRQREAAMSRKGHPDDLKDGWPTLHMEGHAGSTPTRLYKKEYAAPLAEQRKARGVLAEAGKFDRKKASPRVGDLARALADEMGVSLNDAYRQIIQWHQDDVITLQVQSNRHFDPENAAAGLDGPNGAYGYFQVN
jgi:hypothetical protein